MNGMKLSNKTEFAEQKGAWLNKYNIAYAVAFAIVFFAAIAKDMGIGTAFFLGLIFCGALFLVKGEAAKLKRYDIERVDFALNGAWAP